MRQSCGVVGKTRAPGGELPNEKIIATAEVPLRSEGVWELHSRLHSPGVWNGKRSFPEPLSRRPEGQCVILEAQRTLGNGRLCSKGHTEFTHLETQGRGSHLK